MAVPQISPSSSEEAQEATQDFVSAWEDLRADSDIQFAPVELPEEPQPPDWLENLREFLGELFAPVADGIAAYWWLIWPILAAGGVCLLLYMIWRIYGPDIIAKKHRAKGEAVEEEWVPQTGEAIALLKDADALAAEGRYDEATHLLLGRSVAQINSARPDLIEPSSTAREIAALPALPDAARAAFSAIADRVESSLFALHSLGLDDWNAARAAYADFAKVGSQIAAQPSGVSGV